MCGRTDNRKHAAVKGIFGRNFWRVRRSSHFLAATMRENTLVGTKAGDGRDNAVYNILASATGPLGFDMAVHAMLHLAALKHQPPSKWP